MGYFEKSKVNIIKYTSLWLGAAVIVIVLSLLLFFTKGLNWGLDFVGGTLIEYRLGKPFDNVGEIRPLLTEFNLEKTFIQKTEENGVIIRAKELSNKTREAITKKLSENFSGAELVRQEFIGPVIGAELKRAAIIATVLGLIAQVIYISVRFKPDMALAADIALIHDICLVILAFILTQKEINTPFIAILLTVVGYSINDTVVIFDRIRENLKLRPRDSRETFPELVNRSLLETLTRSVNTVLTTIIAVLVVYFLGGSAIKDFAFGLAVGIATGGYSSIFIAAPVLVLLRKREWLEEEEKLKKESISTPPSVTKVIETPQKQVNPKAPSVRRKRR
ncbi:MAG: protein translocase subunit SecF [bacterium]|nr:protein translocase subunit SecF [bacterium]